MSVTALSAVVASAARSVGACVPATDGELLHQFVRTRDENAFDDLVRRLGPMVLGVCRRLAGDVHLAEDAFQAAFVVLARRAGDIRPTEAVRAWLYGVAVRTAREARNVSARRLAREMPVPNLPERADETTEAFEADALRILDEEIARLPEHLRAAVLMCELEGVSRKQASERLGIPEGTLSSRLAKGRKLLAAQLRRRGVTLPTAGLTVLASAAVSPQLSAQTTALAQIGAPIPPMVATISNGVFRTMFLHKLTLSLACALVLVAASMVAWSALPPATAKEPPKPSLFFVQKEQPKKEQPPAAKPAGPGAILLVREGPYHVVTPEGKKLSELAAPKMTHGGGAGSLSPDGKRVAFIVTEDSPPQPPSTEVKPWPIKIVIRKVEKPDTEKEKVWDMPAIALQVHWTADGKHLIAVKHNDQDGTDIENLLLDPETGKTEPLKLPEGVRVLDCGRDGKTFLVEAIDTKAKKRKLGLVASGDEKVRELTELQNWPPGTVTGRLSPDGTKVLFTDADPARKHAHKWGMSYRPYLLDIKTGKREPLAEFPENGKVCGIAWSPDGNRIAYTWMQLHEDLLKKEVITVSDAQIETEAFLMVADADGKNAKTVVTEKGSYAINMILGGIDWR